MKIAKKGLCRVKRGKNKKYLRHYTSTQNI